jgi:predicted DCC family thiol-disulfide oxidoreductase YuxK
MEPGELIYDGDCGFCTQSKNWIMERIVDGSVATPTQRIPPVRRKELGLSDADLASAAYWVDADGRTYRGARGIGHALRHTRQPWRSAGWVLGSPPVGIAIEPIYRVIARNRHRMPGATEACRLDDR